VIGSDELADLAAAVRLQSIRMRNIYQGVIHAVDDDDWALAVLDEHYVAVPLGQNVAQYLADVVFGHFAKAFEWREKDHGSDFRSLLGDEAGGA